VIKARQFAKFERASFAFCKELVRRPSGWIARIGMGAKHEKVYGAFGVAKEKEIAVRCYEKFKQ
jgi:hypothetical protein